MTGFRVLLQNGGSKGPLLSAALWEAGSDDTAARMGAEPLGWAREMALELAGKGNPNQEIKTLFYSRNTKMRHLSSLSLVCRKKSD